MVLYCHNSGKADAMQQCCGYTVAKNDASGGVMALLAYAAQVANTMKDLVC